METKLKIWRKTWGRQSCEGGLPEHAPHVSGTDAWHSASGLRCNAGWRLGPARYMVRWGWMGGGTARGPRPGDTHTQGPGPRTPAARRREATRTTMKKEMTEKIGRRRSRRKWCRRGAKELRGFSLDMCVAPAPRSPRPAPRAPRPAPRTSPTRGSDPPWYP